MTATSLFLNPSELHELTGYKRMADQRKWLTARGWRFEVSACGRPVVSRNYADSRLGVEPIALAAAQTRREWKPNLAAIR